MVKKKYNWAKGYEQRKKDRQREKDQAALAKKRKEAGAMNNRKPKVQPIPSLDRRDWETQEEIRRLESQVDAYRKAWEAEKLITAANREQIRTLRQQLNSEQNGAAFRGMLFGTLVGLILGLIVWANLL